MNVDFQVWDANSPADKQAWLARWSCWQDREVFAHPEYVALYAGPHDRALCATASHNGSYVLYPFLLRCLGTLPYCPPDLRHASDIATPYGYGGPFLCGPQWSEASVRAFWAAFDHWAAEQAVVSEIVRLSLYPDTLINYVGNRNVQAENVVRAIGSERELWHEFDHKVRKNVNRARASGVVIEKDEQGYRFEDFFSIYQATMHRRNARQWYYFAREYFERIHRNLKGQFIYFHALFKGAVISTELVLLSRTRIYSFLGGTDSDWFHLRPNDLLKFEIINWARAAGKREFVLGGGSAPQDGIHRYKLSFAPNGSVPYRIGSRIFSQNCYDKLIEARRTFERARGLDWNPDPTYFPAYRAEHIFNETYSPVHPAHGRDGAVLCEQGVRR